jgi:hypothetical protein
VAIVSVPLRAAPVLAATLNPTEPLPVPLAPDVTVIHATVLVAVHAQVAPLVTVTVPVLAVAGALRLLGAMAYVQTGGGAAAAACDTVNVRLAIEMVPVRAAPVFTATLNLTEPFPVPLDPDVTVIHDTLLPADHSHVFCVAVTAIVPVPPAAGTF